jgi:hypothetical protein
MQRAPRSIPYTGWCVTQSIRAEKKSRWAEPRSLGRDGLLACDGAQVATPLRREPSLVSRRERRAGHAGGDLVRRDEIGAGPGGGRVANVDDAGDDPRRGAGQLAYSPRLPEIQAALTGKGIAVTVTSR